MALTDSLASAAPLDCCPPACNATVLADTRDPTAHTPLPPSILPRAPRPSLVHAPCRSLLAYPVSLPTPANTDPVDSLAGSDPHSSAPFPHRPPPPLPASSLPASQTIHECIDPEDTLSSYHSIHAEVGFAPPGRATAEGPPPGFRPIRPPFLPAVCGSIPGNAPRSFAPTAMSHTPRRPQFSLPLPAMRA